jgi:uncharacterized protein (TIGR02466 family)
MASKIDSLFPTLILKGSLPNGKTWNANFLRELSELRKQDKLGQDWSKKNYRNGYTSYASLCDLQYRTPLAAELAQQLMPYAIKFAKKLGWDTRGQRLVMDTFWMNYMPENSYHTNHIHPHSVISGTYYVSCPPGSVALKLEDPRMPYYMAAPVREPLYHYVEPKAGSFVLFESWLRHEVPPNTSKSPRVSVSFNFSLQAKDESEVDSE